MGSWLLTFNNLLIRRVSKLLDTGNAKELHKPASVDGQWLQEDTTQQLQECLHHDHPDIVPQQEIPPAEDQIGDTWQ